MNALGPRPVVSQLSRLAAHGPMTQEEFDALRARAWAEKGLVVLLPAEVMDEFARQALINEATRRWGRRMKR